MDVKVKAERDAQRMMHGIGFVKARQCAWAAFDYIDDLEAERDSLRAEVAEWFCQGCNRAYPPLAIGRLLQPCPQCDGVLVPSSQNLRELLRLRAHVEELERVMAQWASVAPGPMIELTKEQWRAYTGIVEAATTPSTAKRDLAIAEAVRKACDDKVCGEPLDLEAIVKGVKS